MLSPRLWLPYAFTALLALFLCLCFPLAPFLSRAFYPDVDGIGLVDGACAEWLRALVPFATIALNALHFGGCACLPAVGWKPATWCARALAWWAWGLRWQSAPVEYFVAFLAACAGACCCLAPCLARLARLGESELVPLLTAALAPSTLSVLFSAFACSTVDGVLVPGATTAAWLAPRTGCDEGAPLALALVAFAAAAFYVAASAAAGVLLMPEHLMWPTGVYGHLFDTFVNRALVPLYAALLGHSSRAHGRALARLLLAVALVSAAVQVVARPHAARGEREQTWRNLSELFKLAAAIAANVVADDLGNGAGCAILIVGGFFWFAYLVMLLVPLLCCDPDYSRGGDGACCGVACRCGKNFRMGINAGNQVGVDYEMNLAVW